jgi:D-alanine-D-alanine ligase-like ATP-grasp enzyme
MSWSAHWVISYTATESWIASIRITNTGSKPKPVCAPMREVFINAEIKVARGRVVKDLEDAQKLIKETGYPLVAKPDIGVGAAATYKIHNENELINFFETKPPVDYLFEEFVSGQIVTFDGLTDRDGTPVFTNSLVYSAGIMETVLNDDLVY